MNIIPSRRQFSRTFGALAAITAALSLAACETMDETYANVSQLGSSPIVLPCPNYKIIADTARRIQFGKGNGRDLTDILSESLIADMRLACVTKIDRDTGKGIMEVEINVAFGAKRGPADKTRKATLPYFISVTDLKRNILYREEFKIAVAFQGNQSTVQFLGAPLKLELPLSNKIKSTDYIVYTGFLLSREQLKRNRRLKGRGHL